MILYVLLHFLRVFFVAILAILAILLLFQLFIFQIMHNQSFCVLFGWLHYFCYSLLYYKTISAYISYINILLYNDSIEVTDGELSEY